MQTAAPFELHFADDAPPIGCATLGALTRAIEDLAQRFKDAPPLCASVNLGALEVIVGFSGRLGFVQVQIAPFDGEWYISCGDPHAPGFTSFSGVGGDTAFENSALVPIDNVKAAVVAIAAKRQLPNTLSWRDWDGRPVIVAPWEGRPS